MERIDDEFVAAANDFIRRAHKDGKPFFVWANPTHMHFRTHAKPTSVGQSGRWQSEYHDVMIDHDKTVGQLLAILDELGIAEDTIVFYSTDNGPHRNSWPDAGTTPFRSEKDTNWECAFRVPGLVRWPGKIKAGSVSNQLISHMDWCPASWQQRVSRRSRRSFSKVIRWAVAFRARSSQVGLRDRSYSQAVESGIKVALRATFKRCRLIRLRAGASIASLKVSRPNDIRAPIENLLNFFTL